MDTIEGLDGIKQAADKANALVSMLGLAIDSSDADSHLIFEIIGDQLDEIKELAEKAIHKGRVKLKNEALAEGSLTSAEDSSHIQLVY